MPKQVLLVVDVQNDLCPGGGSLVIPNGDDVVQPLNRYMDLFDQAHMMVCVTRDWHSRASKLFVTNGGSWPVHCVQHSWGASFHPDLDLPSGADIISKGLNPDDVDHSCFKGVSLDGTPLLELLRGRSISELFIGGLATDYGVHATVTDALKSGFSVTVLEDAIRGVEKKPGDVRQAVEQMQRAGAAFATFETIATKIRSSR